jgi:tRNA (cytidine/uridine-2'-O-)-methyltransferase
MPLHVVLFEPEIPPNTGNVIRLCANTGARLHLVQPLGFSLDVRSVRRAGLDYHELADVQVHASFTACQLALTGTRPDGAPARWYALTTKGEAAYDSVRYAAGDIIVFGPESRGLSMDLLARHFPPERRLRIPMQPQARSLNLANAAAVVVYEAWRQLEWR